MTSGAVENDIIELAVLKNPNLDPEIISKNSISHFSTGLKLVLQTQVKNPEHGRYQSSIKGVYGYRLTWVVVENGH